ncbi:hypothetical protein L3X38_028950 [Prunus dulcis]|uniref:Uncharacterized protein n=1 Tax=Prunus dulcis TaxID=3755 RepID=A0AAD4VQX4_PRUDU|nr:hypothetical protein L3X38_028950 [Prunus dulcis]
MSGRRTASSTTSYYYETPCEKKTISIYTEQSQSTSSAAVPPSHPISSHLIHNNMKPTLISSQVAQTQTGLANTDRMLVIRVIILKDDNMP